MFLVLHIWMRELSVDICARQDEDGADDELFSIFRFCC